MSDLILRCQACGDEWIWQEVERFRLVALTCACGGPIERVTDPIVPWVLTAHDKRVLRDCRIASDR